MIDLICHDCGALLSIEELAYYGDRCEACEQEEFYRVGRWLAGGNDDDMDGLYGAAMEPER